ncbi:efflux RND transporter periplasmic adaptor subunit [Serratia proteamaculans]|uniref:Efflux RND transporter periplasmic adaptor subunit n=2 Tax=Serratia proteamaculans TaxID=28151 RepID=A0A7U0NBF1_SERPR|nr:efflux RND transporter periplasmic adaptor subunit [Serratia proteamaculans]QQX55928.1 efflux RND transporter periplasmic adaptor subunit [Serratia proteamaculans]HCV65403.1 efflux transporter periplasmic adaptor subunit [Serratia sp. (in: enterobacteria)]
MVAKSPSAGKSAALLISICFALTACEKAPSSSSDVPLTEVGVVTVKPKSVQLSSEFPGRTNAFLIAEVRPQVSGVLLKREFREGSNVSAGQVLYQIDPAPYRATLARAEASLGSAKLLFERYQRLVQTHAISQQQRDDARSQYLQAKAVVESARIDLNYTRIAAPISGHIGRSTVTQGALVTASQTTALATIQQLDPIYVDITQPATTLLELKENLTSGQLKSAGKGQAEIRVMLDNGRIYPHPGTLQFSEVSVDESTGAVTLRAVVPNPEGILLPGMFVRAQLQEGVSEQALLIPQRSVTRDTQGKANALILDDEDRVLQRSLVTERSIDGQWLIRDGLHVGDRVIVDGIQKVQPGMQVKPMPVSEVPTHGVNTIKSDAGK